jgi:putative FmdB family regulatory protein
VPIYDYVCSACGQLTEVIHGIDASAPRYCPVCGKEGTLRKTIAAPAVVFKGSGWAKKDRSSSRAAASKSGADAGEGGGTTKQAASSSPDGSGAGASSAASTSSEGKAPGSSGTKAAEG